MFWGSSSCKACCTATKEKSATAVPPPPPSSPPPPPQRGPAKLGCGMAAIVFLGLAVILVVLLQSLKTVLGVLILAGLVLWWLSRSAGGSLVDSSSDEMERASATTDADVRMTEERPNPTVTEDITANEDSGPPHDDCGAGSED